MFAIKEQLQKYQQVIQKVSKLHNFGVSLIFMKNIDAKKTPQLFSFDTCYISNVRHLKVAIYFKIELEY